MIISRDVEQLIELIKRVGREHVDLDLKQVLRKIIDDDLASKEIKNENMRLTSIAETLEKDMNVLGLRWKSAEVPTANEIYTLILKSIGTMEAADLKMWSQGHIMVLKVDYGYMVFIDKSLYVKKGCA